MIIYVGNIAPTVTEKTIKKLFEQYGTVTTLNFVSDPRTKQFKGFAFLNMPAHDEALLAIDAMHGIDLEGAILVVTPAPQQE